MAGWKGIVGKAFSVAEFEQYCETLQWTAWRPSFAVLHNTGVPSLAQRPKGFTQQHMDNFASYYRDKMGWSAGPHLFIDDTQIWVFSPLTAPGVHSPSWNSKSLGVEMLGDFAIELFDQGRGAKVRDNAMAALAILHTCLGLDPKTLHLHWEDPRTTHACPGKNVKKLDVIQRVLDLVEDDDAGDHAPHAA
jgi:hypothetical protein